MQAVGPAPARHGPAGKLIDDDHLVVLDDIIDVVMEQGVRPQRRVQMMQDGDVHRVVQAHARLHDLVIQQQLFHPLMARFRQVGLFALFVEHVIAAVFLLFLQLQAGHNPVHAEVQVGPVVHHAGDDKRRARLIDQYRIHFVHNGILQAALRPLVPVELHVVAQVVEAEFVVGPVDDIGAVGLSALFIVQPGNDHAGSHAQEGINRPHPLGVALRQVVVHGDDVHSHARQGIQVCRQRRHQGLAFAGAHFSYIPLVQYDAAEQLHIEMAHVQGPFASLAHQGECLRYELLQGFAAFRPGSQLRGLLRELGVRERGNALLERVDPFNGLLHAFQDTRIPAAEQFCENGFDHVESSIKRKKTWPD